MNTKPPVHWAYPDLSKVALIDPDGNEIRPQIDASKGRTLLFEVSSAGPFTFEPTREGTTIAIQSYLDSLKGSSEQSLAEPIVRELLGRATQRLHVLCASLLRRSYPRLTRPPVNLQATEMLSAVIERMLKALREARPGTVRQFCYIAGQHMH